MDCLPADEEGKPLKPARDMNMYVWSYLLPQTGLPILLGDSVSWFPTHRQAYSTFWIVGGAVGIVAYVLLALLVHPQEEPLGKTCQCTRHWQRKELDERRRRRRLQESAQKEVLHQEGAQVRRTAGVGALLCDRLLFGASSRPSRNRR